MRREVAISAVLAAAAIPVTIATAATPAAAGPCDGGNFNDYHAVRTAPIRRNDTGAEFGTAFLYYNRYNRCIYGKVSYPRALTASEQGYGYIDKTYPPTGQWVYGSENNGGSCSVDPGSNYCLTGKWSDAGWLAQAVGTFHPGAYYGQTSPMY